MSQALTPRQEELLRYIAASTAAGDRPQVSSLIQALGLNDGPGRWSSLSALLKPLERKGYVTVRKGVRGRERLIALTARGVAYTGHGGLPLLGSIPAGPLREVLAEQGAALHRMDEVLPTQPGDFLLEVRGDSMIGDGILPGDWVLLRPDVALQSGEIAAVHVGDEYLATLKRVVLHQDRGTVTLRAANPNFPDVEVMANQINIAGVFRGLVRRITPSTS